MKEYVIYHDEKKHMPEVSTGDKIMNLFKFYLSFNWKTDYPTSELRDEF